MIDTDRAGMIKAWLRQAHSSFLQDLLQYVEQLEVGNERLRIRCQQLETQLHPADWGEFEMQEAVEL